MGVREHASGSGSLSNCKGRVLLGELPSLRHAGQVKTKTRKRRVQAAGGAPSPEGEVGVEETREQVFNKVPWSGRPAEVPPAWFHQRNQRWWLGPCQTPSGRSPASLSLILFWPPSTPREQAPKTVLRLLSVWARAPAHGVG